MHSLSGGTSRSAAPLGLHLVQSVSQFTTRTDSRCSQLLVGHYGWTTPAGLNPNITPFSVAKNIDKTPIYPTQSAGWAGPHVFNSYLQAQAEVGSTSHVAAAMRHMHRFQSISCGSNTDVLRNFKYLIQAHLRDSLWGDNDVPPKPLRGFKPVA